MSQLILSNIRDVVIMVFAGMGMMLIYDSVDRIRLRIRNKRVEGILYVLCFLFMSKIFSDFLYSCAYGKISFHSVGAVIIGIILWKKIIYDIIVWGNKNEKTKEKNKN